MNFQISYLFDPIKFRLVKSIFCFFAILNFTSVTGSENAAHYEDLFRQANEFYSKANYDSSILYYESIAGAEYESANLYYNLANACYKKKNIPAAVLYYEKAKKLKPDDGDILFNLQLVNQQITDKIEPLPELFLTKWWNGFISSAPVDSWGKWVIILAFYAAVMFAFFIFSGQVIFRKIFFWSGVAGIILAVISFSFALKQEKLITESHEAIVFAPSITAKSSPDENSTNLFVIHEGAKVKILEKVSDWYKISLADGNIGWIKEENVKEI